MQQKRFLLLTNFLFKLDPLDLTGFQNLSGLALKLTYYLDFHCCECLSETSPFGATFVGGAALKHQQRGNITLRVIQSRMKNLNSYMVQLKVRAPTKQKNKNLYLNSYLVQLKVGNR